ncbi:MAG: alanine racemase [Clostridia bacterium]|nr:alanine racemase [Clostridia bacterium]
MDSFNNYIIDSKQLVTNVVNIKNSLNAETMLCAVVKADAYGLGLEKVCDIIAPYVDYFAVACVKEAKKIRSFNKVTPVIILSVVPKDSYKWCADNNISVTVVSDDDLIYIENNIDVKIKVHISINS